MNDGGLGPPRFYFILKIVSNELFESQNIPKQPKMSFYVPKRHKRPKTSQSIKNITKQAKISQNVKKQPKNVLKPPQFSQNIPKHA